MSLPVTIVCINSNLNFDWVQKIAENNIFMDPNKYYLLK